MVAPNTQTKFRGTQDAGEMSWGTKGGSEGVIGRFFACKLLEPPALFLSTLSLHLISYWQQQQRKKLSQMNAVYV